MSDNPGIEAATTGPAPLLEVANLRFRYRNASEWALDGVSIRLLPGEILLVAGPSGCGKTTLLRCLNGLIPRSYREGVLEGQIRLGADDASHFTLAQLSLRVGTLLQNPEKQIIGSAVATDVAFGLENLAVPRAEMKVRVSRVLDGVGITDLADRSSFDLSGGEKQKTALAGILAMEPSILLLDEPLSSLDPASAAEALSLVRALADAGKAVVLIEHRVEDALELNPNRALLLRAGRPEYYGDISGFLRSANPTEVRLPAAIETIDARSITVDIKKQDRGTPPLLEFDRVAFCYENEDRPALLDASLCVIQGDVLAVLGSNGAGKSTLLKLGIGLLRPQRGRVIAAGVDAATETTAQLARRIGYVFQNPQSMFFAPTVREELSFGPRNLGHTPDRIEAAVENALQSLDLKALEHRSPLALSYGQQKRVSIAAILAMECRVLLLDEPTAGQDYQHTIQLMEAIRELFEAVIFITHDLDLAIRYANRVALLSKGCIVAFGPSAEVLSDFDRLRACRLRPTALLQATSARNPPPAPG